jgi:uncharacterized protein
MKTNRCQKRTRLGFGVWVLFGIWVLCFGIFSAPASPAINPVIPLLAHPLPLSAVRLTGGPLKHAEDLDAEYLLKLEPDRMLFHLRERAGLEPKAKQGYGGWDAGGRQLTGHICGHYLSAISYMWAATGDPRFKERIDYIVSELKQIQDKQGDGYLGALMGNARPPQRGAQNQRSELLDGKLLFAQLAEGKILSGGFDLNGMWSPWYVEHKIFAGLRDAYRLAGNRTALEVETRFAEWADGILSKLSEAQIQRMLATEFGGMNEVMIDLYADTADKRWLKAADYFEHHAIIDPLARHEDILAGKHGNTQVPKLLGALERYIYTGESRDGFAAAFFWDCVAEHHSFVTGGHGRNEYFGQSDKFTDMIDGRTAESCNVYNMLKMTRKLFSLWPDPHYADFHERALFNHILGSIDPENGSTCYMVCVGQSGHQREYADMFESFTCCVGTGMESQALHADGLYYEGPDRFWINIYAPSTAEAKTLGLKIEMQTDFPEGESAKATLTLASPREFTIALRRPFWTGTNFAVKVNGETMNEPEQRAQDSQFRSRGPGRPLNASLPSRPVSSYVVLKRAWKTGDTIELSLPKALRLEALPDNPQRAAIMWGPLALAGDLGPEQRRSGFRDQSASTNRELIPAFVAAERPVDEWVKPVVGKPGTFRTEGVGRDRDVELVPFYRLQHRWYNVYWKLFTPEEWGKQSIQYASDQEKKRKLEAATVAFAQPGEMQPERDFNFQGEDSSPVRVMDRPARRGAKWFSFDLPVDSAHPMILAVTYNTDEPTTRSFEILVDGKRVARQTIERRSPEQIVRFFDVEYPIPAEIIRGKQKVTVRFQAVDANEIAAVFGLRMVRADAER